MSVKRLLAALVVFLILLALTACTLSASTPPPTTPTTDSAMSTLEAELGNIATQTAAAGGGSGTVATPGQPSSPGGTPEGGGPTPTPQPDATQAPQPEQPEQPDQEEPDDVPEWKPTPGLPQTYTLQKFEFPFCIARRFNLNQSELLSLNGLGLNSVVPVGFTLRIPQTGNHFVGERALQKHPTTYTVVAGDTIYSIACKFGSVDPNGIIAVNKLKSPYNLSAGQKLAIP
jgi:LysM repeat protein